MLNILFVYYKFSLVYKKQFRKKSYLVGKGVKAFCCVFVLYHCSCGRFEIDVDTFIKLLLALYFQSSPNKARVWLSVRVFDSLLSIDVQCEGVYEEGPGELKEDGPSC